MKEGIEMQYCKLCGEWTSHKELSFDGNSYSNNLWECTICGERMVPMTGLTLPRDI